MSWSVVRDLLVEACLVDNGETEIHRYSYATRYIHIMLITYVCYREQSICGRMCCCTRPIRNTTNINFGVIINVLLIKPDEPYFVWELCTSN